MRILGSITRLVAAAALAAAAGLLLPGGPAAAATCSSADGVSVVVDFHELGGGVQTGCVSDGGGQSATSLFPAAGFELSFAQRQAGFVCRVSGKPSSDPCVNTPPADAYWALFWSDGKSGTWTYSTTGAGSLKVPAGGYVAFSWNGSSARSAPGVAPTVHAATPTKPPTTKPPTKPTPKPTPTPTKKPSSTASAGASPSTSASASATPSSATPSASVSSASSASTKAPGSVGQPTKSPGGVDGEMLPESAAATVSPSTTDAAAEPSDSSEGGLPAWVGPVVVVGLFAAGGAVAVVRRRRASP